MRGYNGDGISFQQSNDVTVTRCTSEQNTGLGIHPGSGAQRPAVREGVARGVIQACVELGFDPAEKIAVFRIPGAWEDEGFKILEKYGVEYYDRTVSMHEAAKRAVEKIQGAVTA